MVERLELAQQHHYEPLPSLSESGDGRLDCPDLVGGESVEWAAIGNLDAFFTRIYRYWLEKGWLVILASRLLNLAALAFTVVFSAFLLLGVDWGALHSQCLMAHDRASCDILTVAVHAHPLRGRSPALVALAGAYVGLCCLYWLWSAAAAVTELRSVLETRDFVANKLGISERQVRMMTWSEVLHRIVLVQRHARLCAVRDLDEHDIVARIMRKDNYLIGMLNAGVLALHVPAGPLARWGLGVRRRFVLTKTLEWNIYWGLLDPMWDENGVAVRPEWLTDEAGLKRRLRLLAVLNLAVAPFLLLFLVIYFTMKNAERFYHSPGTLGSRRWSSLAKWRLRELNELPHYVSHRLAAGHEAAVHYLSQFPSPLVTQVARFVSFVAGSFAALLLGLSLLDENLLEVPLWGRNVVWWLALTGMLLAASRAFISESPPALDPERAMAELVAHTHHLPRHWRGRAHTAEVQEAVAGLFQLKLLLFAEELASVLITPFILGCSLPKCAGAILSFVREHTTHVEGVGDVCSLAAFDFDRHGNPKYGAPSAAPSKAARSKQGKMEKSFLTFVATYPTWAPPPGGRALLAALSAHTDAAAAWGRWPVAPPLQAAYGEPPTAAPPPQQPRQPHPPSSRWPPLQPQQPHSITAAVSYGSEKPDAAYAGSDLVGVAAEPLGVFGPSTPQLDGDDAASWLLAPKMGDAAAPEDQRRRRQQQHPQQQQQQQQLQQPQRFGQPAPPVPAAQQQLHQAPQRHSYQQHAPQPPPPHHVLQVWPSTLYPGGPNAAAALPHLGCSNGAFESNGTRGDGAWSSFGGAAGGAWAAASGARLGGAGSCGGGAGSDLLPVNEAQDLSGRLAANHLLLQSFYESRDATVQHRHANRAHARSVLLQRALDGGALSVAPFLASASAMAAGPPFGSGSHMSGRPAAMY